MKKEEIKQIVELSSIKMAQRFFEMMLNVNYHGINFSWDDEGHSKIAKASWFLSLPLEIEYSKEKEEYDRIAESSFNKEFSRLKKDFDGELPIHA